MKILNTIKQEKIEKSAIALGKFDGVHLGHQAILEELKKEKEAGTSTVVVTFTVSPESILSHKKQKYIMTDEEKKQFFASCGIDYFIDIPLDQAFLDMEAEDFIRQYLKEQLGAVKIVCGENFRFGKGRKGNVALLKTMGRELGFETKIVTHVKIDELEISSTRIREEITKGNVALANRMLGHPYFVSGKVVHGKELGRTIEFPTINLVPQQDKILPPNGVYVTDTQLDGKCLPGITNIGFKPTVGKKEQLGIETHIFDYQGYLYEKEVKVYFKRFIRPEQKFSSLEELKQQIAKDILQAK